MKWGEAATYVGAAQFKATCLELVDRVKETGVEYVVTKHGHPVARVVPCVTKDEPLTLFGCMKGTVLRYDRPLDPIDADFDIDHPSSDLD